MQFNKGMFAATKFFESSPQYVMHTSVGSKLQPTSISLKIY